jgi:catechol 2,3-dioxygenase-like lactoylglutathione lyase family enzyme
MKSMYPKKSRGLDHIAIEVLDIGEALKFYRDLLGFAEIEAPEQVHKKGIRWLSMGRGQALHLVENKNAQAAEIGHLSIQVDDVSVWRKVLKDKGVEILKPRIDLYNAERFFFRDPSGNRIEFIKWSDK